MNTKEYISSGIIESCVLGLVTEAERKEFETICVQYPEIAAARNAFEKALETQLLADAKKAPPHIKERVWERLSSGRLENEAGDLSEERKPVRSTGIWKWLAAASIILLAGAIYWAIRNDNKLEQAEALNKELQQRINTSADELSQLKEDAVKLQHPGMKVAALKGMPQAPAAFATIYWDTTGTRDVYLMVNNLPEPPSDKQYQLWAMLDGKPIDLGIFDMAVRRKRLLVKMKNVQNAQAFAITLEPSGGSTNPTMPMYVMGEL